MPKRLNLSDAINPETAALCAAYDWARSPFGCIEHWPAELRVLVQLMLRSATPQHIVWGPERRLLYNDGYIPVLGDRHPAAFGSRFDVVFADIWDGVGPIVEQTYAGVPSFHKDHPWTLQRPDGSEDIWISFSYTPVEDASGQVLGFHCDFHDTTAEVRAAQHRAREVERLRTMFEQAPGFAAMLSGPDHVFESANPAYYRLVGGRELEGRRLADALPEIVEQGFIALLDRVYASGEAYVASRVPFELVAEDGSIDRRHADFVYQPIRDANQQVCGIFVQGTDVTAHVRTDDELREATRHALASAAQAERERRWLDAMLQAVPVGIAHADRSGRLALLNAENRVLWGGQPPPDPSGNDFVGWNAWWADGSERSGTPVAPHEWALARALDGEQVCGDLVEIEPFDRPGERRNVLLRAAPIRNEQGAVEGAVVAQLDITDRIRTEAELRRSEARFRTISDAMPQMVWSTRADGYHDYYNQRWYAFTGAAPGETDGDGWAAMFHADDLERTWQRWRHSLATGELYEIEYRLRHHSGEYRWVLGRALPVRDDAGTIIRWMGTCTDIHEQKLAQARLEASEQALREADSRKDEFLAMLAHELRNPLAPITTAAELLRRRLEGQAQAADAVAIIARQARHMTRLVDDLLDVSRVTRGLVELDRRTVDVKQLALAAIEQVRPLIERKRHGLETRMDAGPQWVCGDPTRLVQVIANLLNNAAKYSPDGSSIHLRVGRDGDSVTVTVSDNGSGIDAALLPKVFDLFTQGKRGLDRQQGGLGIGLALVRSVVGLHDGRVHADSPGAGHGSRFTIELPVAAPPPAEAGNDEPAGREADRLRIGLVEDNEDGAAALALLLEAEGHAVVVHASARSALDAAMRDQVDVYLLDIGLPDMDGYALARGLRSVLAERPVRLFALTGYGQDADRRAASDAGFDAHFVKPISPPVLMQALRGDRPQSRLQRRGTGASLLKA